MNQFSALTKYIPLIDNDEIVDDWCCVRVGNNKGWMRLEDLERI